MRLPFRADQFVKKVQVPCVGHHFLYYQSCVMIVSPGTQYWNFVVYKARDSRKEIKPLNYDFDFFSDFF